MWEDLWSEQAGVPPDQLTAETRRIYRHVPEWVPRQERQSMTSVDGHGLGIKKKERKYVFRSQAALSADQRLQPPVCVYGVHGNRAIATLACILNASLENKQMCRDTAASLWATVRSFLISG